MQYILLFVLFILFPLCGIQALQEGKIGTAIFFFTPITILICCLVVNYCFIVPHKKRQETVRKKYNIPEIVRDEYGEVWDKEFQKVRFSVNLGGNSSPISSLRRLSLPLAPPGLLC